MIKFDKNKLKTIAIITTLLMIVCHGYAYSNIMFSHDSLRIFHWGNNLTLDSIQVGRYLIPIFLLIRGKYYPPFLIGIFSIFFMIFINYFLIEIFSIRDKLRQFLIMGLFVSSCTLTLLNATYINYSDMYLLSMFLSIYGAFLFIRYEKGYLYCIIPLFISLGIYQSFISVFVGIIVILSIMNLINNKDTKEVFKFLFKAFISVAISLLIYFIILKVVVLLCNVEVSDNYNSVSNAGKFKSIFDFVWLFVKTYLKFAYYTYLPSTQYKYLIGFCNFILTILILKNVVNKIYENKISILNIFFIFSLLALLPFFLNFVCFLSSGVCHQLMIYSFYLIYIFIFMLYDKKTTNKVNYKIAMSIIVITIFSAIIFSNNAYLKKHLEFYSTMNVVNRITYKIENISGYKVGETPVIIVGDLNDNKLSKKMPYLDYKATGLEKKYSVTYYDTYINYYDYFLNYSINIIPKSKINKNLNNDEKNIINGMKAFPDDNSIQMVNDKVIVKLSDIDLEEFLK